MGKPPSSSDRVVDDVNNGRAHQSRASRPAAPFHFVAGCCLVDCFCNKVSARPGSVECRQRMVIAFTFQLKKRKMRLSTLYIELRKFILFVVCNARDGSQTSRALGRDGGSRLLPPAEDGGGGVGFRRGGGGDASPLHVLGVGRQHEVVGADGSRRRLFPGARGDCGDLAPETMRDFHRHVAQAADASHAHSLAARLATELPAVGGAPEPHQRVVRGDTRAQERRRLGLRGPRAPHRSFFAHPY